MEVSGRLHVPAALFPGKGLRYPFAISQVRGCAPERVFNLQYKNKSKAIPVTGLGGLQGCEMLRIPHCLDNRLTDGGKVVGPTHPPHFTPHKHYYFNVSGTYFCYRLSKPPGLVRPEGFGKLYICVCVSVSVSVWDTSTELSLKFQNLEKLVN
jgi:hypothetical protein